MSFLDNWNEDYPAGSTGASELDTAITESTKRALRERLAVDHYFLQTENSDDNIGYHNKATLVEQSANPDTVANTCILFTKQIDSYTELFMKDEQGNVIQLTSGGTLGAATANLKALGLVLSGDLTLSAPPIGDIRQACWFIPSSVATGTNKSMTLYIPFDCTITRWRLVAGTAPTGADLIIDINKNGTTIWSTQANRAKITAGNSSGSGTTFDTTSITAGQYLTIDIDQVGSTVAGSDISIMLELTVA